MKYLLATAGILLATSAQAVSLQNLSEQELTSLFSELDQNPELSLLDNTSGRQVKVLRVLPKTAEDRAVLPVSASCITFYGCDDKVCLLDHNGQKFLGALSELQTTMRRSTQGNDWQECRYQAPYAALTPKAPQAPASIIAQPSQTTDVVTSQPETSFAQAQPTKAKVTSTVAQVSQQPQVVTSQAEVIVQPEQSVEQIEQPIEPTVVEQAPVTSDYSSDQYLQVVNVSLNDVLNIRQAPNARAAKVAQMAASTSCIKNFGCEGQWCQIEFLGLAGWSHSNYLAPLTGDALAACQQRGY